MEQAHLQAETKGNTAHQGHISRPINKAPLLITITNSNNQLTEGLLHQEATKHNNNQVIRQALQEATALLLQAVVAVEEAEEVLLEGEAEEALQDHAHVNIHI